MHANTPTRSPRWTHFLENTSAGMEYCSMNLSRKVCASSKRLASSNNHSTRAGGFVKLLALQGDLPDERKARALLGDRAGKQTKGRVATRKLGRYLLLNRTYAQTFAVLQGKNRHDKARLLACSHAGNSVESISSHRNSGLAIVLMRLRRRLRNPGGKLGFLAI
jgi:hypothetical protein